MTNTTTASIEELQARLETLANQIGWLEDKQGFAPKALKQEFRSVKAEIHEREWAEHYSKVVAPMINERLGLTA